MYNALQQGVVGAGSRGRNWERNSSDANATRQKWENFQVRGAQHKNESNGGRSPPKKQTMLSSSHQNSKCMRPPTSTRKDHTHAPDGLNLMASVTASIKGIALTTFDLEELRKDLDML